MLNITKTTEGGAVTVLLEGRLDTTTAPQLEAELQDATDGIDELTLALSALEYVSSAGLRVLLSAQKRMSRRGGMKVAGANKSVREIFEITGFDNVLTLV